MLSDDSRCFDFRGDDVLEGISQLIFIARYVAKPFFHILEERALDRYA